MVSAQLDRGAWPRDVHTADRARGPELQRTNGRVVVRFPSRRQPPHVYTDSYNPCSRLRYIYSYSYSYSHRHLISQATDLPRPPIAALLRLLY